MDAVHPTLARFGLGPRLAAIAERARGRAIVDVGTDHALIPIALLGSGWCTNAIGIEKNEAPLQRARENAQRFGVQVDLRLGEGLAVAPGEVDTAILAGMGGRTIAKLVMRAPELQIDRLLIQPNSDFEEVRHTLAALGYPSTEERFVADGERFFLMIVAERGTACALTEAEAFLGLVASDPLYPAWAELQRIHRSKSVNRSSEGS